jgi:hypothetical protein
LRTPRWNRCRRNAPHELRQHDQVENPHILFGRGGRRRRRGEVNIPAAFFSVPSSRKSGSQQTHRWRKPDSNHRSRLTQVFEVGPCWFIRASEMSAWTRTTARGRRARLRGTDGSNPASSTGGSCANLTSSPGDSDLSRGSAPRAGSLVDMLPPLPRCSRWAYSSLKLAPSISAFPEFHYRVGLHIVLFEVCSAYRGRDGHYWPPPAQIRTRPTKASGSYLGCLTSKRSSGQG